ncbi:hypothetical protein JW898_04960 [Candidatus Woesearchaeota archaeon]|nr:hypothetical protein [Candidatus Woesearchaeota archaeon]
MTEYRTTYCLRPESNAEEIYHDGNIKETPPSNKIGKLKLVRIALDKEQERIRRLVDDYLNDKEN